MQNKIYNMAVIGCRMGEPHIKAVVSNDNANLYAACDLDDTLLARIKETYKPEIATKNWKELINDPKIDAVIVATPDKLHLEMTEAFLMAGGAF